MKSIERKWSKLLVAVAGSCWVGLLSPAAHALQQVATTYPMPVKLDGSVGTLECSNAPGPQVTLDGAMHMGGLGLQLIFRNNINKDVHVHEEEVKLAVALIAPNEPIVIPKQPVQGGTGGNPFIWVQLLDNANDPLTGEIFLGRCVQGPFNVSPDFASLVTAMTRLSIAECTNSPGPYITVDGGMSFDRGVKARFIFRNNDNPVGGPHEADAIRDVTLIGTGKAIQFPKQPVQGGVGGNPWISAQFLDGQGNPIGNEILLGRCVQL